MKKKQFSIVLLSIFLLCFGTVFLIPASVAAPADSFGVTAGQSYYWKVNRSSNPNTASVGDLQRITVTAVNESLYGGMILGDSTFGTMAQKNISKTSWSYPAGSAVMSISFYNGTDPMMQATFGFGFFGLPMVGCFNTTAYFMYLNFTMYLAGMANNSAQVNTTTTRNFTFWKGSTSGDGLTVGDLRYVYLQDPTNYLLNDTQVYTWTGSAWNYTDQITITDYTEPGGGSTTPPIPGFELVFILMGLGAILGLYYWKKTKIEITQ